LTTSDYRRMEESITLSEQPVVEGGRELLSLNIGPHHPATHGVLRLLVTLDGEILRDVKPIIGYVHTGIEKTAEQKSYWKAIPVVERMDYLSYYFNAYAFCGAVETLLEVDVPKRAQYLRVIHMELNRIMSHLVWLGTSALDQFRVANRLEEAAPNGAEIPQPVRDLFDAYHSVSERRLVECWHDALQAREQALQMFNLGYLSLEARGLAERLYWATCARISDLCRKLESIPEELEGLEAILSDIYFCNFSVFQSLPDSWAIGQLFPIMPIHRLDERPTRNAVLADITCDSDGKIDRFVSLRETKRTLEVHELRGKDDYYLAAFLVGAYQETLGDLHNLFGDTHVVHIRVLDEGGWWIEETVKGDTALQVLGYMEYDTDEIRPRIERDCERAVREGRLTVPESQRLKRFYEAELNGYAYLEPDTEA